MGLTRKQRVFIDEYVKCWNGAEAARRAGYSVRSAREIAVNLLADISIKAEIDDRLATIHMSSEEVLKEISDIARGDMGQFLDNNLCVDISEARKLGLTKLIKKIKQKTVIHQAKNENDEDTEVHDIEIELYDKLGALEKAGKYHGLFKEQLDVTSGGEKLTIRLKAEDGD